MFFEYNSWQRRFLHPRCLVWMGELIDFPHSALWGWSRECYMCMASLRLAIGGGNYFLATNGHVQGGAAEAIPTESRQWLLLAAIEAASNSRRRIRQAGHTQVDQPINLVHSPCPITVWIFAGSFWSGQDSSHVSLTLLGSVSSCSSCLCLRALLTDQCRMLSDALSWQWRSVWDPLEVLLTPLKFYMPFQAAFYS